MKTAKMAFLKLLFVVLVYVTLTEGCQPPDCDRKDCGSCGNSCCGMLVYWPAQSQAVYNTLVAGLKQGGPDSRYTFKGGYDLRKDNLTVDFILQGWHTTLTHHYNDSLDFTIAPVTNKLSLVNAFSISQIATAYCDAGQNYKNIISLLKQFGVEKQAVVNHGCPMS